MENQIQKEYSAFRHSVSGRIRVVVSILSMLAGLYFWFHDLNLWLTIPMGLFTPLLLYLPGLVYQKASWIHESFNLRLLKIYEFSFIGFILLSNSGSAYLFYLPYQFDILVHFLENVSASFLVVLLLNLRRQKRGAPPYSQIAFILLMILWGLILGLGWEAYQFSCDALFGSRMAWDSVQTKMRDSSSDFIGGLIGLFLGLILLTPQWPRLHPWLSRKKSSPEKG